MGKEGQREPREGAERAAEELRRATGESGPQEAARLRHQSQPGQSLQCRGDRQSGRAHGGAEGGRDVPAGREEVRHGFGNGGEVGNEPRWGGRGRGREGGREKELERDEEGDLGPLLRFHGRRWPNAIAGKGGDGARGRGPGRAPAAPTAVRGSSTGNETKKRRYRQTRALLKERFAVRRRRYTAAPIAEALKT